MITSKQFPKLEYKRPFLFFDESPIQNIIGIDSESYKSGEPFIFCTSEGDVLFPVRFPYCFISEEKFNNVNFVTYNLKYDSGALLYHLPMQKLKELQRYGDCKHNGFSYEYIKHKCLKLKAKHNTIYFWDISQFYNSSLEHAASKYINEHKKDIETKTFTKPYFRKHRKKIIKYCVQDALLTKKLALHFIQSLKSFGIHPSKIYSTASISFTYFNQNSKIVDVYHLWKDKSKEPSVYRKLLAYAVDSYDGGKFEITQRGYIKHAWEYDITSAYPYHIRNLMDIKHGEYIFSKKYLAGAQYGFLKVRIYNNGDYLPCGINCGTLKVYPAGEFYTYITLAEFDYILTLPNVDIELIDGWYIFIDKSNIRYPYRETIDKIYRIKEHTSKKENPMLYAASKIIMNGFYGKCVQCIEQKIRPTDLEPEKTVYKAGAAWNPIYGAYITALTRIQIAEIQNKYKGDCAAVHTDSVIMKKECPELVNKCLGKFSFETSGEAIIIACGMYKIGDTNKFRGFEVSKKYDWKKLLKQNLKNDKISFRQLKVESWLQAAAQNHGQKAINFFDRSNIKEIDLNCDLKRLWPKDVDSETLLTELQSSDFLNTIQLNI